MQTLTSPVTTPVSYGTGPRRLRRVGTIITAALAAGNAWLLETGALGIDLTVPAFTGQGSTQVGPVGVITSTLILGLAGWGLLAILEHAFPRRGRRAWTIVAIVVTLLSILVGPSSAATVEAGLALTALHVIVGALVIVGFRWAPGRHATTG